MPIIKTSWGWGGVRPNGDVVETG